MLNASPCYDDPTQFSRSWNQELLDMGVREKVAVNLVGEDATQKNFNDAFSEREVIIHFGHGIENALVGHDNEILIRAIHADKLKNKKTYSMSCTTARVLGIEAYKSGCKEYWGSIEPIGFVPEEHELFGSVYNMGAYQRFYEGRPIKEVLKNMENKFNENMDAAQDPWTRVWLRKDRDSWKCWSAETPPPPEMTGCVIRRTVVTLIGPIGWKIPNIQMIWKNITRIFSRFLS